MLLKLHDASEVLALHAYVVLVVCNMQRGLLIVACFCIFCTLKLSVQLAMTLDCSQRHGTLSANQVLYAAQTGTGLRWKLVSIQSFEAILYIMLSTGQDEGQRTSLFLLAYEQMSWVGNLVY